MRWNSEYHMMERLLEQRKLLLSEWSLVAGIVKILQPIDQATTQLCSDEYPSLSFKIPLIYRIVCSRAPYRKKGTRKWYHVCKKFSKNQGFRCIPLDSQSVLAMTLDHQFQLLLLESHEKISVEKKIVSEIEGSLRRTTPSEIKYDQPKASTSSDNSTLWHAFDKLSEKSHSSVAISSPLDQLNLYLSKKRIPRH
ncbi:hypothetical protein PR048_001344 [Dryococelus australis]|uniref:Uncharacterized protein n=1 Tax=Dryococelus australis TaxID=614101 RepID=A0ABQ9IJH4_9NEOP|nr:hypothetical protein PR048_001344 [Dryococelus australis]